MKESGGAVKPTAAVWVLADRAHVVADGSIRLGGGANASSDRTMETTCGADERSADETARGDGAMELPATEVVLRDDGDERSGGATQPADELAVPPDARLEPTDGLLERPDGAIERNDALLERTDGLFTPLIAAPVT